MLATVDGRLSNALKFVGARERVISWRLTISECTCIYATLLARREPPNGRASFLWGILPDYICTVMATDQSRGMHRNKEPLD